jgi:hypothetical protein
LKRANNSRINGRFASKIELELYENSNYSDSETETEKSQGPSLMVSAFICPCHGIMHDSTNFSYKLFQAGKGTNRDGWRTNSDLVKQYLDDVLPLFEKLHPRKKALVMFDNSQNHNAKIEDGLDAAQLNRSKGGSNISRKRDGWYMRGDTRITHSMNIPGASNPDKPNEFLPDVPKGIDQILTERGIDILSKDLITSCPTCSVKDILPRKPLLCCVRHCLSCQPDFKEQRSSLREIVEDSGHFFLIIL